MAGQASHRSTDRTGPAGGRSSAGRARVARLPEMAPLPIDIDDQADLRKPTPEQAPVSAEAPLGPDVLPRTIRTQASYRLLTVGGLTGAEAAGLIGYVVGLKAREQLWTLKQINRLLFLRELYASSDWGAAERKPA